MRAARLAAAARRLKQTGGAEAPFSLAYLTDPRGPSPDLIARVLPPGAAIIDRNYKDPRRAARAAAIASICRRRGVSFLIGGDPRLALAIGADGVHLRSDQLAFTGAERTGLLLTASCHSSDDLRRAAALGAHAAFLSPVFPTRSHPGAACLGVARFRALGAGAALPVLALGGVDEFNARLLAARNVAGFGAIDAFDARQDNS